MGLSGVQQGVSLQRITLKTELETSFLIPFSKDKECKFIYQSLPSLVSLFFSKSKENSLSFHYESLLLIDNQFLNPIFLQL